MFHDGKAGIVVEKGPGSYDGVITINTRMSQETAAPVVVITYARQFQPNDGVLDGTNTGS